MTITDSRLAHVRVHDAMHTGVLTTDPSTPLRVVARLMAQQHVHAVAVADPDYTRRPWGIITALNVAAAAAEDADMTAGEAAAAGAEIVTIPATESLEYAAQLMLQHGVNHLVVVDAESGHPSGILSTLDVAAVYAA
jgi:CBS domain-containing protein